MHVNTGYRNTTRGTSSDNVVLVELILACQMRVTVDSSGVCCLFWHLLRAVHSPFMLILFSFCLLFPCFLLLEAPFSWLVMTMVFCSVFVDGEIDCVDYLLRTVFPSLFPFVLVFSLLSGLMQHWICEWSLQGVLLFLRVSFGHETVLGLLIFCVSYSLRWCNFVVHFLADSVKEIWCSNWWWYVWEKKILKQEWLLAF